MRWSAGSASATATCRKAASAATPTFRCARPARPRSARAARSRTSTPSASCNEAIDFEVRRQIELIEDGGRSFRKRGSTILTSDETRSMRSKEDAHDYRYFPDPDLLPLVIATTGSRASGRDAGVAGAEAAALCRATYGFRAGCRCVSPRTHRCRPLFRRRSRHRRGSAQARRNWILGRIFRAHSTMTKPTSTDAPIRQQPARGLLARIADGTISDKIAKDVFDAMWAGEHGGCPMRSSPRRVCGRSPTPARSRKSSTT